MNTEVDIVNVGKYAAVAESTNTIRKFEFANVTEETNNEQRYHPLPTEVIEAVTAEPTVPRVPVDKSKFA